MAQAVNPAQKNVRAGEALCVCIARGGITCVKEFIKIILILSVLVAIQISIGVLHHRGYTWVLPTWLGGIVMFCAYECLRKCHEYYTSVFEDLAKQKSSNSENKYNV